MEKSFEEIKEEIKQEARAAGLKEAAEWIQNPARSHGAWTNRETAAKEILQLARLVEKGLV